MGILPTVGRIVYYKTRGSLDGVYPQKDFASIITGVNEDGTVNLVTFGETGIRFELQVQKGTEPGCWDWMPFQKDQQARLIPSEHSSSGRQLKMNFDAGTDIGGARGDSAI